jgi:hypothetical protein
MRFDTALVTFFLALTLLIAVTPLWFPLSASGPTLHSPSTFRPWWAAWVLGWGSLAVLTTAGLPYGVPQVFRFLILFVVPVVLGTVLMCLVPAVRTAAQAIPLLSLVRWQQYRIVGGFFLVGAAMGHVSMPFALIAGVGDVAVGLAAILTAHRMQQVPERAAALAKRHAWLGMADFTMAVGTALLTKAQIGWPYSLIPLFLVPIAILGHVVTLQRKHI